MHRFYIVPCLAICALYNVSFGAGEDLRDDDNNAQALLKSELTSHLRSNNIKAIDVMMCDEVCVENFSKKYVKVSASDLDSMLSNSKVSTEEVYFEGIYKNQAILNNKPYGKGANPYFKILEINENSIAVLMKGIKKTFVPPISITITKHKPKTLPPAKRIQKPNKHGEISISVD